MYSRYWIEFKRFDYPTVLNLGCGVTAESQEAALALVGSLVFEGKPFEVARIIANVSLNDLDEGHVLPNMGNPVIRGVWFPLGYAGNV